MVLEFPRLFLATQYTTGHQGTRATGERIIFNIQKGTGITDINLLFAAHFVMVKCETPFEMDQDNYILRSAICTPILFYTPNIHLDVTRF